MAENVGSIRYTTEVDTSDTLTAEKQIDKATNDMANDFKKVDTAVKKTSNEIKKTTKAVDAALTAQNKATERAAKTAERTAERKAKAAEREAERAKVAANKAADAEVAAAKRAASAVAREAKKAEQAKQAAAERSTRAVVATNRRAAASEQKRIAGFGRSSGQAGIQVQQFVGQIQGGQNAMLALSAQAADLGFVLGAPLLGAVVGISASIAGFLLPNLFKATEGLLTTSEAADKLKGSFDKLNDQQKAAATLVFQQKLKKDEKALEDLRVELGLAQNDLLAVQQVGETFISGLFGVNTKKATQRISDLSGSIVALEIDIGETKQALGDLGAIGTEGTSKFKEVLDTVILSLEAQTIALRDGEQASFRFNIAQQLGLKTGEQIPDVIDAQIDALFKLKAAQDATKESDTKKKSVASAVGGIGISQEDSLTQRLEQDQAKLDEAVNLKLISEENYLSRVEELNKQHEEKMKTLREKSAEDSIINFEALENQIVGTFAAIATGAQDGKAAISSLASAVLTQMVGALIKMGIQAVIGQTTAAAATSAAMGTIAVAAAPAAALVSLATAGANAAPAGVGIATVTGLAESVAIAGGRQFGGPVNGGDAYRVGEAGPEIFSSGGKNFMIPGENGKVIANDDIGGGSGFTQNVEIVNNTPANVSTSTSNDGKQMRIIINEIANQINTNQGIIPRSLKSNTNTKFKANS